MWLILRENFYFSTFRTYLIQSTGRYGGGLVRESQAKSDRIKEEEGAYLKGLLKSLDSEPLVFISSLTIETAKSG
jgi:hypothetical protein